MPDMDIDRAFCLCINVSTYFSQYSWISSITTKCSKVSPQTQNQTSFSGKQEQFECQAPKGCLINCTSTIQGSWNSWETLWEWPGRTKSSFQSFEELFQPLSRGDLHRHQPPEPLLNVGRKIFPGCRAEPESKGERKATWTWCGRTLHQRLKRIEKLVGCAGMKIKPVQIVRSVPQKKGQKRPWPSASQQVQGLPRKLTKVSALTGRWKNNWGSSVQPDGQMQSVPTPW